MVYPIESTTTPVPALESLKLASQPTITVSEGAITPPITLDAKIESLRPQLSSVASINFPSDAQFKANTERWSTANVPNSQAVVNVATEEDIVATVLFPTSYPFSPITPRSPTNCSKRLNGLAQTRFHFSPVPEDMASVRPCRKHSVLRVAYSLTCAHSTQFPLTSQAVLRP